MIFELIGKILGYLFGLVVTTLAVFGVLYLSALALGFWIASVGHWIHFFGGTW